MACNPLLSFSLFAPYPHRTPRAIRSASALPLKEWGHRFQDNFSSITPAVIAAKESEKPRATRTPGCPAWWRTITG